MSQLGFQICATTLSFLFGVLGIEAMLSISVQQEVCCVSHPLAFTFRSEIGVSLHLELAYLACLAEQQEPEISLLHLPTAGLQVGSSASIHVLWARGGCTWVPKLAQPRHLLSPSLPFTHSPSWSASYLLPDYPISHRALSLATSGRKPYLGAYSPRHDLYIWGFISNDNALMISHLFTKPLTPEPL